MGNMEEAMEEATKADMDMMMDRDDLYVDTSTFFDPKRRSLCDLPSELIGMIAECLDKKDLHRYWCVGNRVISKAIDHVWTDAHFSYLKCETTDGPRIARLVDLSNSRFAKRIRTIEIRFHLKCEPEKSRNGVSPCMEALLEPAMKYALESVLNQAVNLREILIRAPNGVTGLWDSMLTSTLALPSSVNNSSIEDLRFSPVLADNVGHTHVINTASMCHLFSTIMHTIQQYPQREIQEFGIVDFANTSWKSALLPTDWMHTMRLNMPALQNMTTLDLQFEMFTFCSEDTILGIVKAIEKNASLQVLKLRAGRRSTDLFQSRCEHWAPLLALLGTDPPFRLRTLELDGLVTSTIAPTLDRIIDVHAYTIRRLVLAHLNFHPPNSLRTFCTALAKTDLKYFSTSWFFLHERAYMVGSSLQYYLRPDEVLEWGDYDYENDEETGMDKDEGYRDWIDVDWALHSRDRAMVYDNESGVMGEGFMRRVFLHVVGMIDDGGIRDRP